MWLFVSRMWKCSHILTWLYISCTLILTLYVQFEIMISRHISKITVIHSCLISDTITSDNVHSKILIFLERPSVLLSLWQLVDTNLLISYSTRIVIAPHFNKFYIRSLSIRSFPCRQFFLNSANQWRRSTIVSHLSFYFPNGWAI